MKFNLSVTLIFITFFSIQNRFESIPAIQEEISQFETDKKEAFIILENKCNACHLVKKKKYVFTEENISSFAKKIHLQVFIKKKMPKGDLITLSSQEEITLLKWLQSELELSN